jgi:hypothetical protein
MSFKTVADKVCRDVFTENDGTSYCPVRVIGGLLVVPAIVLVLAYGSWAMFCGRLAPMEFVQVVGVLAGTVGVVFGGAVALKALTDRPVPPQ